MAEKLGFDILLKGNNLTRLFAGMGIALRISVISVVISLGLGLVLGTFLSMKKPVLNAGFSVYLNIVRFMPQLVLLFIVYFGATKAMSINLEAEPAAVIVFSFWGIAEMADLVRAALISIPVGQYESSVALGLNTLLTYVYVIIPQAIRRLIPQSINLVTRMIKTTSLVMMIGIVEVLKVGQQIIEAGRKTSPNAAFGVFATVFLMYFLVCWPISLISKKLEKKWENGYG